MGFADRFSLGRLKKDQLPVTPAQDTEFGTRLPPFPIPEAAPDDPNAPLRIGSIMGRKRGQEDEAELDTPLPLIGHLSLPRQLRILLMVLGAGILMTVLALWRNAASSADASALTQVASDALMHSQRIGKAAPNAVRGNPEAFAQLEDSRKLLTEDLQLLSRGGNFNGRSLPSPDARMARVMVEVTRKWKSTDNAAATILKMQPELLGLEKSVRQLDTIAPLLLNLSEELLDQKVARGGSPRELAALGRMMMMSQRMSRGASDFLTAGAIRSETAFQLGRDATAFGATIDAFNHGNSAMGIARASDAGTLAKLEEMNNRFDGYQETVGSILNNLGKFSAAKAAEQSIFYENEDLKKQLTAVQETYRAEQGTPDIWFWLMVAAAVFTLLTAASVSRVLLQDSRNRTRGAEQRRQEAEAMRLQSQAKEEEAKATNDQNQAAILRLMNELQEVADGDLTIHATVSEDITGAIADSVNYTVEELRGLVGRVTRTAEQVTSASTHAQEISTELLNAARQQSREIEDASATVLKLATEITDVSRSATESAHVARQSVAAATQGATAVENAIVGMHEIRDQIQETSKRIKRLGESSQEIGEITELISDITEQTNVLALNAAIQAASAGEAGRGFSVVAEEVQRLAERSAGAAKQIGALVRTIQTDTHDAVAAMEKSTQGVVEGARLSDAAGTALSEISRVSNQLAELIEGISHATEKQATSANGVAGNIGHILEVTQHTQEGTQQTAQSIRQLSVLAQELKNSVSRFRVSA
ncbi:MAG TPA: methyl-accepting chemotaxis protein [Telluria sp.]